jgi:hypothetical protein
MKFFDRKFVLKINRDWRTNFKPLIFHEEWRSLMHKQSKLFPERHVHILTELSTEEAQIIVDKSKPLKKSAASE